MSIQWTFIAGYLYFEIAVVSILLLPIASPRKWNQFFKSRLFAMFREHAAIYFYVLLAVLTLFSMDAIREMRKYSHSHEAGVHGHLASEMKGNVKLFRAQRNFYITGFAIFLAFVIRRLVKMIIIQAELLDRAESIIKEAEAAKDLAKTTMLAQKMQSAGDSSNYQDIKSQLELTEKLLAEEKNRGLRLEEEICEWKAKYHSLCAIEDELD